MRGQSAGTNGQAQLLLGKERMVRLDPAVPDGVFALDKVDAAGLMAHAAHESRQFSPMFAAMFRPHVAPAYEPSRAEALGESHAGQA